MSLGRTRCAGTFEKKEVIYLGSFLDPEVIKILCLGVIVPMIRMGHKGPLY